jgi:class 3 adenylate cyclase/tRNA A-37 threonylcarbamoyl transferase component Bud32
MDASTRLSLFLLKPVVLALRIVATVAFVTVPALLLVALLPFLKGSGSYPWLNRVVAFDSGMIDWVHSIAPTGMGRLDLARPFLVIAVLLVGLTIDSGANRLATLTSKSDLRRRLGNLQKSAKKFRKHGSLAPLESKLERLDPGDKKSREELVRLMVEAKRELDAMSRYVAFLALDVVGSTNMKVGEDAAFIEHDFKAFKKMVDGVIAKSHPLKSAWTPDGAMICFDSLDDAVQAAQAMLRRLGEFNAGTRVMQTPFRVRCGINAGEVQYDKATSMEEMSDHVIDVAGHMQKHSDPDTIFVAADLIRRSKVKRGFTAADTEVDGYDVHVWRGPSADAPAPQSATLVAPEPHPAAVTGGGTVPGRAAAGATPTSLGKYEVRRELGRGAMGIVYEGWDPGIERRVALKTVRPDQLDSSVANELRERFRREAQAAGRLSHPGIVSVYDFGQEGDTSFIAMEFIDGEELQSRLDRGDRLAVAEVVEIMTQLLNALDTAGKAGVVHRDIKPSNILLLPNGRVKVTDFGIARVEASGLTQDGSMLGTPAYMSPEQLNGLNVDPRSDLFSSGVVLYQLLTGERPFRGTRVATIIHKILEYTPPDPSTLAQGVPETFDAVVRKAIAKAPGDRYQSGAEFAEAIRAAARAP